jgi:urease accessory protein
MRARARSKVKPIADDWVTLAWPDRGRAMDSARLVSVLQFADSAFPAGGYAHSFGLEAYVQAGLVRDWRGVLGFLRAYLEGATGPCEATAAVAARAALGRGCLDECRRLDEALEAMKPVREFREASRQMGRQTLRVAAVLSGDGRLAEYLAGVQSGDRPGHHGVTFGLAASALDWGAPETATALLYSSAALLVGAALRLLPLGQLDGQRLLRELQPLIARLADEALTRSAADLWSFCPGLEIQGVRHRQLPARLFRS